jgi:hypothetical protein
MDNPKEMHIKNNDNNSDGNSTHSNLSQDTNIKVFKGFSSTTDSLDYINQLNQKKQPQSQKNSFTLQHSVPTQQDNLILKNPLLDIISFGNGNIFHNTNTILKQNKEKESPNSHLNFDDENESDKSKKSIRSMSVNDPNENMVQFITTEGIINPDNTNDPLSSDNSRSSQKENIFSKICKGNDDNETILDDNNKKQNGFDTKDFLNGNKNNGEYFTVSTIEKGVALLVSNNDCIFTMPISLLPKGVKNGTIYKYSIEEDESKEETEKKIQQIQNKLVANCTSLYK